MRKDTSKPASTSGASGLGRSLVAGRQTRPTHADGFTPSGRRRLAAGGMGAVPLALSGEDFAWLQRISRQGVTAIQQCYRADWRRLLRILVYIHELGGLGLENDVTLCAPPVESAAVAYLPDGSVDDDASAACTELFEGYEYGGLPALVAAMVAAADTDGIGGVESVVSQDLSSVSDLLVVDGLSLRYRDTDAGVRVLEQRQDLGSATPGNEWQELATESVHVAAWRASRNVPMGFPRFFRFLRVGLPDIWEQLMLSDWVQGQAYGRIAAEMDIKAAWEAINQGADKDTGDNPMLRDEEGNTISATEALAGIIADAKSAFEELESSDTLFGAGVSFKAVNPGGSAIKDAFELRANRLFASLLQPPSLMYSRMGGALSTSSDSELRHHKGVLTALRAWAVRPIERAANLHLRLLGSEAMCRIVLPPIQLDSGLEDARADSLRLRNAGQRVLMGFTSGDTEATEETGTALEDPAQHDAWKEAHTADALPSDSSSSTGSTGQGN